MVSEKLKTMLKKHNQNHLLAFWDELEPSQQKELLAQIEQLDFDEVNGWVEQYVKNSNPCPLPQHFDPAPYYPAIPDSGSQEKYKEAVEHGQKLLREGKVAAFVVAGGQGTRLGFDGPKGNFPISPVKNKTLFTLFAEMIAAASKKYGQTLPWYIMTSPLNHQETIDTFKSANYFGLDKRNIFIFQQGTMPNFCTKGRILAADKAQLALSPDGHGGSLKALYKSGATSDMKRRGVKIISYFQVDNPLINIFDPLLIGLHALDKAEMSSKALIKAGPLEKVGNFCLVDGKVTVIEYSDLPDELANKRNPDGSLVFQLGSIAIHIISRKFVEKLNAKGFALPFHRAVKKIPHIDQTGKLVEPSQPNGIKLETFVFDALPLASKSIILETLRSEEFGPVKNASGTDSAETARQMMTERAAAWLEYAGVKVPRKPDGTVDAIIEISAGFALDKEELKAKAALIKPIMRGEKTYL
ncbi:MAG: UDPGP type 1 family protein [Sedimentisphaerales bacterium]|nr:UDPGP type 1 family protein [Sedimentisphaerales bacterium]